ncbi:MAG: SAM-dependent methyltransferase, partial [Archaeoglobaceae archaeon]
MKDDQAVDKAKSLIQKGLKKNQIVHKIKGEFLEPEDIYEVAKHRIKAKDKFGELADELYFDEWGLRYSTPKLIAQYRAERLKCKAIADISCGVGAQLIFFAEVCDKVFGVEIDKKRALYARMNAKALGLNNVEIIRGDAFNDDVVSKISDADVFFSDPSRPPEEKVRSVDNLEPNPLKVFEKYRGIGDVAFELPPQMPPSRIPLEGEKEYTSLNFKLNRLALYTGDLARSERSAISIPSQERVSSEDESHNVDEASNIDSFLYEVDNTVLKAELLPNLLGKLDFDAGLVQSTSRRTFLTADEENDSAFLRKYEVLEVTEFDIPTIKDSLKKAGASKVTLRFSLDPSEYWN